MHLRLDSGVIPRKEGSQFCTLQLRVSDMISLHCFYKVANPLHRVYLPAVSGSGLCKRLSVCPLFTTGHTAPHDRLSRGAVCGEATTQIHPFLGGCSACALHLAWHLAARRVAVTTDFATRFLTEVREMQVLVLLVALLSVCSWTTLSVDGKILSKLAICKSWRRNPL